jgi:hypothetical protein
MDAQFQADNQNLLAKYNYNLPIAQSLMGHEPNFYQTPVQASPFAQVLGGIGSLAGTAASVALGGGQLGMGWWGGGSPLSVAASPSIYSTSPSAVNNAFSAFTRI